MGQGIYRAIMESTGHDHENRMDEMRGTGNHSEADNCFRRRSNSNLFMQIFADVLGFPPCAMW